MGSWDMSTKRNVCETLHTHFIHATHPFCQLQTTAGSQSWRTANSAAAKKLAHRQVWNITDNFIVSRSQIKEPKYWKYFFFKYIKVFHYLEELKKKSGTVFHSKYVTAIESNILKWEGFKVSVLSSGRLSMWLSTNKNSSIWSTAVPEVISG